MLETSERLLRLLSLLQSPRDFTGPELAARLRVSTRTVRNDVGRLRTLGYPVHATRGSVGGYDATCPTKCSTCRESMAATLTPFVASS